jgi:proteasome lid subunit RPN8/RPN11
MTIKLNSRTRRQKRLQDFRPPPGCRRVGYDARDQAVALYVRREVLESLCRHARANPRLEVGGYLFGHSYEDAGRAAVEVVGSYPITTASASLVHFRFEVEDGVKAERHQHSHFPGTEVVGWYHTHPGHGVFLSGVDVATHVEYFRLFHRVAVVLDPLHRTFGAFVQEGGHAYSLGSVFIAEDPAPDVPHPQLAAEMMPADPGPAPAPGPPAAAGAPAGHPARNLFMLSLGLLLALGATAVWLGWLPFLD